MGAMLLQRNRGGKWIPGACESSPVVGQNFPGHEKTWLEAVWAVMEFKAFPLDSAVVPQSAHTLLLLTKRRNGD